MASDLLARAFTRVSRVGLDKVDRATARYVQGSNQYLVIALASAIPFEVLFLVGDGGRLHSAALVQGAVIAVWFGCFALNTVGWMRAASIIELVAPLIAFAALTWLLSYRAGFLLPMLMTPAVAFVTFAPRRLRWGMVLAAASAVAVAWSFLDPRVADPRLDVSTGLIHGMLIANVALVTVVLGVTSALNHYYFSRERARAEGQLAVAQELARTDSLTRLANRRGMVEALAAVAKDLPYSIALIDLDRFKEVNDTLGHAYGDAVLTEIASILDDSIGELGMVARWGGEEFLVLMTDVPLSAAIEGIERARMAVEALKWTAETDALVTFSAGLAAGSPGLSWETTVRVADALLYNAKDAGRNRVEFAIVRVDGFEGDV
ncbi:MAG: GGDEF domain-containing protein [Demequinaceae bacterium]|nr:GGDEF domain-containing protein [Demequinaceae bacterium]